MKLGDDFLLKTVGQFKLDEIKEFEKKEIRAAAKKRLCRRRFCKWFKW